ncbi:MAG TPA: site-2 protease family protein [Tepidisphaeraceae bacterium]|nr:site-2 protease family protein [Tepidisphaeraceae bacterium]
MCIAEAYLHKVGHAASGDRAVNFALFFVFTYLLIVPHELGHVLAAWLLRWDMFRITFGIGPCWMKWRIAGILIRFRLIPDRGSVSALSFRQHNWRVCRFIFIAAGPLMNLAIAVLAIEFAGGWRQFIDDLFANTWSTLGVASAFTFFVNLVPQTVWTHEGASVSDGLQMARLLFKPLPSEKIRRAVYYLAQGGALMANDDAEQALKVFSAAHIEYPEDPSIALSLSAALMKAGKVEEGRSLICRLLQLHTCEGPINATLRNNLAWADLLIGSPMLLAEADEASTAALFFAPWEGCFQGTRGAVLAFIGKPDKALHLLRQAEKNAEQRSDRSALLCAMAIAEHRRGHQKVAAKLVDKARHFDPKCKLLSRAEEQLAGHPVALAFSSVEFT